MAGLDYRHVREPGFDPAAVRQSDKVTGYIEDVCRDIVKEVRNPRGPGKGETVNGWFSRRKTLYYDTDAITEYQTESVRLCDHCRGVVKYETESTRNPLCLGVEAPIGACERCVEEAYRIYEAGQIKGEYRHLALMDRVGKNYLSFTG